METKNKIIELPINRAIVLDNITCPYCGNEFSERNDTKEHVIGKRFVPKGSLNGQWNLILRACKKCNGDKSTLENDISAITQAGRYWFSANKADKDILSEANRKSKNCTSSKTGKPVIDSQENIKLTSTLVPGIKMSFDLVSPPQIDIARLYQLARMQIMAFFYLITYNRETNKGGFWPGEFCPLSAVQHSDWGNTLHKTFMEKVYLWELKWIGNTADGFFKSIIKRNPSEKCWSWALEWNNNYRLVGFFGEWGYIQEISQSFPSEKMETMTNDGKPVFRVRKEESLQEDGDLLFSWDDGQPNET